jgi:response regulator RpfG family c-di-GMP phosphodiesterase
LAHYRSSEQEAPNPAATPLDVGQRLRLNARELAALEHVALLHDIGKIGIPDSILRKPGPLDTDEWAVMRTHPVIGASIVASMVTASSGWPIGSRRSGEGSASRARPTAARS